MQISLKFVTGPEKQNMQISFSHQIDVLIKKLMTKLNYPRQCMQYVAELRLNKGLWTPFLFYSPRHCEMQTDQIHKSQLS